MKKIAIITAVAMLALSAASCGGSSDGGTTGGTTSGGATGSGTQATSTQAATFKVVQLMQNTMSTAMSNMGNAGAAQVVKNLKDLGIFKETGTAILTCTPTFAGTSETVSCTSGCAATNANGSMTFTYNDITQIAGGTVIADIAYNNFSYDCVGSLTGKARYTMTFDMAAMQSGGQNANQNCTYTSPTGTNACPPATTSDSDVDNTLTAYGCGLTDTACSASGALLSVQEEVLEDMIYTRSDCTPQTATVGAGSVLTMTICGAYFADANCRNVYNSSLNFTGSYNGQPVNDAPFNISCDSPTDLANYQP